MSFPVLFSQSTPHLLTLQSDTSPALGSAAAASNETCYSTLLFLEEKKNVLRVQNYYLNVHVAKMNHPGDIYLYKYINTDR